MVLTLSSLDKQYIPIQTNMYLNLNKASRKFTKPRCY